MAGTWTPSNDFENEIVSLNPDRDFIFGNYEERATSAPRPEEQLNYVKNMKKMKAKENQIKDDELADTSKKASSYCQNKKLRAICKVENITKLKRTGSMPTVNDWDNAENLEKETIALMRNMGMDPLIDQPFSEVRPATCTSEKDYIVMQNGKKEMPIFYDEKYFSMKPKKEPSFSSSLSSSSDEESFLTPNSSKPCDEASIDKIKYEKVPDLNRSSSSSTENSSCDGKFSVDESRNTKAKKFYSPKELYFLKAAK